MMKTMEKLMERMFVGNRPAAREQHDPQPRNQNLRRGQVPQIRQREQREQGDHKQDLHSKIITQMRILIRCSKTKCIVAMTKTCVCF
jgi:hypothetical protein